MTVAQITFLVAVWQDFLRLNHWEIDLYIKKTLDHRGGGCIKADHRYKTAQLFLCQDIADRDIEHAIAHELLHLTIGGVRYVVFKMKDRVCKAEHELMIDAEEAAVDLIARIITDEISFKEEMAIYEQKEAEAKPTEG